MIEFITKKQDSANTDIRIYLAANSKNQKLLGLSISADTARQCFPDERLLVGFDKKYPDRMYLVSSPTGYSFKTNKGESYRRIVRIPLSKLPRNIGKFYGDYNFGFDYEQRAYYIDTSRK